MTGSNNATSGWPTLPSEEWIDTIEGLHLWTQVGLWPGNRDAPEPIFYAYAYPTPDGFSSATVQPEGAFWLDQLGEFAPAQWDRTALECAHPEGPEWWHNRPQGAA